jgi:hypothetical protein
MAGNRVIGHLELFRDVGARPANCASEFDPFAVVVDADRATAQIMAARHDICQLIQKAAKQNTASGKYTIVTS